MSSIFVACLLLLPLLYAIRRSRQWFQRALAASFIAQRFDTPQGIVGGDQLDIVKVSNQVSNNTANSPSELFCYCVGPGPSYFLAIAHVNRRWRRIDVDWTMRPLTAERMRGALIDDRAATAKAFGPQAAQRG